jgi:hypothetical protein
MTQGDRLIAAVSGVDWAANVKAFANEPGKETIANHAHRLAVWSRHLEAADKGNPALVFVREMQSQAQCAATLLALAMYKAAAAAMRAMFESALYYTYFRSHHVELQTLVRDPQYYIDKKIIVQFHNAHTPDFKKKQEALGFVSTLDKWYSTISAVIHGQIPGKWVTSHRIQDIKFHAGTCTEATTEFGTACDLVHKLMLCTIDTPRWYQFTQSAKAELLKGLPPEKKQILSLPSS